MTTPSLGADAPLLGFGLGLRPKHYPYIFEHSPAVDWFEAISENFMDTDGRAKRNLARIKERYPVVLHGVALSIGAVDPLNAEYLTKLKALIDWVQPAWVSDHLCWTGIAHTNTHDLLPMPYTEEALAHVVQRIKQVQDFLGRRIALENPSTYLEFSHSSMPEAEFIARMAQEADCNLLLDINNVYVSCFNHRWDANAYLAALPMDRVVQIHLSGHSNRGTHIIDTHDDHVIDPVWALYRSCIERAGRTPSTMVEWDDHIPDFPVLMAELEKAKDAARQATLTPSAREQPSSPASTPRAPAIASTALALSQSQLQTAILSSGSQDSPPEVWIRAKSDFPADQQLQIYINGYRARLFDVASEDYPVLRAYLGDAKFSALMREFVNATQSDHFNIGRYAIKLQEFLLRTAPKDVFAHELCALETALSQLQDAEETPALTQASLSSLTPERLMTLRLHPRKALQLMAFAFPTNAYFRAVKEEESPKKPRRQTSFVAVFRHEDVMWRMDLDAAEHRLLTTLFSGTPVGEALAASTDIAPDALFSYFSRWIRNGLLRADVSVQDTGDLNQ